MPRKQAGNQRRLRLPWWWNSFKKRHPQLTLRTASRLAYSRAVTNDPEVIENYFDLLEETLRQNGILDQPTQLFNCDESGFSMDHKPGKLIGLKKERFLNMTTSGEKAQLTVLACVCAAGYAIPPMIIFDRKRLKPEFTVGEIPGTLYAMSGKGWIDSELFENWFSKHFLSHAPSSRPLLLLLDGHSSHYQPSVVRKAAKCGVILFCLPLHTTQIAQPFDRACFSPLKAAWNAECQMFMCANPGKVVSRYNFTQLFARAWAKAMNPANIALGFRATGVYPFDRNAIKIPGVPETERCSSPEDGLAEATGLAYIPLYSPAPPRSRSVTHFSEAEIRRFEIRYENGYDLNHDERYNLWLGLTHASTSQSAISLGSELDTPDVNNEGRESPLPFRDLLSEFFDYTKAFPGAAEETETSSSLDKLGEPSDTSRERKRKKRAGRFEKKEEGREGEEAKEREKKKKGRREQDSSNKRR